MKAIILAAGRGSRLGPLTDDRPKAMVAYNGKPMITRILETLRHCRIDDITVVKGYKAEALKTDGAKSILNERYAATNMVATLFCAEQEMDDDVIISYADIVYEPAILQTLIDEPSDFAVVVDKEWKTLWSRRGLDPLKDAETLKLNRQGYILEIGKKPATYQEIQGQYIGLLKIRRSITNRIRALYRRMDRDRLYDGARFDQMYMTTFIQHLIHLSVPVKAVPISGGWREIDTPEDLKT
ncbi:MAG: phosphocholine cytidylyltransferase family protein [Deltaproteobacteria bacterium]|nr:phosphocholine cytidylyltransferase family protein [Deltaproteobacteria bacterium]